LRSLNPLHLVQLSSSSGMWRRIACSVPLRVLSSWFQRHVFRREPVVSDKLSRTFSWSKKKPSKKLAERGGNLSFVLASCLAYSFTVKMETTGSSKPRGVTSNPADVFRISLSTKKYCPRDIPRGGHHYSQRMRQSCRRIFSHIYYT
jgi:hypothetical protein